MIKDWSDNPDNNEIRGNINFSEGQTMGTVRPSVNAMFNEMQNYINIHSFLVQCMDKTEQLLWELNSEGTYLTYINPSNITKPAYTTYKETRVDFNINRNLLNGFYQLRLDDTATLLNLSVGNSIPSGTMVYSTVKFNENEWRLCKEFYGKYIKGSNHYSTENQTLKHNTVILETVSTDNKLSYNPSTYGGIEGKHRVKINGGQYPVFNRSDKINHTHNYSLESKGSNNKPQHITLYLWEKL